MTDTNKVIVLGRLTRDAEKGTVNETTVLKMSIAVNNSKKGADGKHYDEANYFDAEWWGKLADSLSGYCLKGKQVAITGSLKQDRWEKDGQKYSKIKIMVESLQLLGGGKSDNSQDEDYGNFPF